MKVEANASKKGGLVRCGHPDCAWTLGQASLIHEQRGGEGAVGGAVQQYIIPALPW